MPVGRRDPAHVAEGRGQAVVDRGPAGLLHVHEEEPVRVGDEHGANAYRGPRSVPVARLPPCAMVTWSSTWRPGRPGHRGLPGAARRGAQRAARAGGAAAADAGAGGRPRGLADDRRHGLRPAGGRGVPHRTGGRRDLRGRRRPAGAAAPACHRPRPRAGWDRAPHPTSGRTPKPPHDFRVGIPDARLFPFDTWRRLVTAELRVGAHDLGVYADPGGHPPLREAIARQLALSRGVTATPTRCWSPSAPSRRSTW